MKKIRFMISKFQGDLKRLHEEREISQNLTGDRLLEYYLLFPEDFTKLNKLIVKYDDAGIPMNRSYIDVNDDSLHYYPISIGQVALAIWETYCNSGNREKLDHFLRIADWFCSQATQTPDMGAFWLTHVPKPEYGVYEPWKSAFSQSRGISVLLRAWQATKNDEYLELAGRALLPFEHHISDGGVRVDSQSESFYEEYVAEQPTRVLDGHHFSLFGLYDFIRVAKIADPVNWQKAEALFYAGIRGLEKKMPEFDMGYWVRFNLCEIEDYPKKDPCSIGYLHLVIAQMKILYRITNEPFLEQYYHKFQTYFRAPNLIRMYVDKAKALRKLNRL